MAASLRGLVLEGPLKTTACTDKPAGNSHPAHLEQTVNMLRFLCAGVFQIFKRLMPVGSPEIYATTLHYRYLPSRPVNRKLHM